jgi:hypothetical protein
VGVADRNETVTKLYAGTQLTVGATSDLSTIRPEFGHSMTATLFNECIVLFTTVHISFVDHASIETYESRLSFSIRGTDSDGTRLSTREA